MKVYNIIKVKKKNGKQKIVDSFIPSCKYKAFNHCKELNSKRRFWNWISGNKYIVEIGILGDEE